ncbi:sarcosine oxidase subunit gamma [Aestuariispira insulae]|uniref:Heterotetrameric sarcosine oxidase gamma subunit n=1 Tax=Aestuariispira insulae TaxID=1461337 RepID=A0A3D9H9D0_9PROT|nr:sarcosine oxidase subunit gamma family protein [Aestuariispira insulae]RED45781.1 heterotetrameric sarcosine oxidase gamma subunit [Aestuariispira insulae]
MADIILKAKSPLDGFSRDWPGITLREVTGRALVSVSIPHGGEAALGQKLSQVYGTIIPAVGESTASPVDNAHLLGLARDQFFILFDEGGQAPLAAVSAKLAEVAYLTDQSDSWAMLHISGPNSRAALARICLLDLHPDHFQTGQVARTVMEHLGVIILRDGADSFLLLSARSSAQSFLHAVTVSAENVT